MLEEDFSWLRSAVRVSDGIGDLFAEIEDALKIREKGKRTSPPPFP